MPAPAPGAGNWAGAPSAALDGDGALAVAYRAAHRRAGAAAASCSPAAATRRRARCDARVAELDKERFGAESLERPALVRLGDGWRLYLSCATPGSKHWWICALDAPTLEALAAAEPRTVLAGDARTGVKDPVIRRRDGAWHAWICCHPLDVPGEEDRMTTAHATSADGLDWTWHGTVLAGVPAPGTPAARA